MPPTKTRVEVTFYEAKVERDNDSDTSIMSLCCSVSLQRDGKGKGKTKKLALKQNDVDIPLTRQQLGFGYGSAVRFPPVAAKLSNLVVLVVDKNKRRTLGRITIPLNELPYVHPSVPFGPVKFYKVEDTTHFNIAVRIGVRLTRLQSSLKKTGEWRGKTAGGSLDQATWIHNPQFFLTIPSQTDVRIIFRSSIGLNEDIGFYLIKVGDINDSVHARKISPDDLIKIGADHHKWMEKSDTVIRDVRLDAGYFTVIPCTKYPNTEGMFELTVTSVEGSGLELEGFGEFAQAPTSGELPVFGGGLDVSFERVAPDKEEEESELMSVTRLRANLIRSASIGDVKDLAKHIEEGSLAEPGPLNMAAMNGQNGSVRLLLSQKADVNTPFGEEGYTPIMMAAIGGHVETMKLLLESKANIQSRDKQDQTLLHLAARSGSRDAVATVLKSARGKIDIDARNQSNSTALMIAAKKGFPDVVRILTSSPASTKELSRYFHPADVNLVDNNGFSALLHAAASKNVSSESAVECAKALLEVGADPTIRNYGGENTLLLAAFSGQMGILKMMSAHTDGAAPRSTKPHLQTITRKDAKGGRKALAAALALQDTESGSSSFPEVFPESLVEGRGALDWNLRQSNHYEMHKLLLRDVTDQSLLKELRSSVVKKHSCLELLFVMCQLQKNQYSLLQIVSTYGRVISMTLIVQQDAAQARKPELHDQDIQATARGQLEVLCLLIERGEAVVQRFSTGGLFVKLLSRDRFFRYYMGAHGPLRAVVLQSSHSSTQNVKRPLCPDLEKCTSTNPQHFVQFAHTPDRADPKLNGRSSTAPPPSFALSGSKKKKIDEAVSDWTGEGEGGELPGSDRTFSRMRSVLYRKKDKSKDKWGGGGVSTLIKQRKRGHQRKRSGRFAHGRDTILPGGMPSTSGLLEKESDYSSTPRVARPSTARHSSESPRSVDAVVQSPTVGRVGRRTSPSPSSSTGKLKPSRSRSRSPNSEKDDALDTRGDSKRGGKYRRRHLHDKSASIQRTSPGQSRRTEPPRSPRRSNSGGRPRALLDATSADEDGTGGEERVGEKKRAEKDRSRRPASPVPREGGRPPSPAPPEEKEAGVGGDARKDGYSPPFPGVRHHVVGQSDPTSRKGTMEGGVRNKPSTIVWRVDPKKKSSLRETEKAGGPKADTSPDVVSTPHDLGPGSDKSVSTGATAEGSGRGGETSTQPGLEEANSHFGRLKLSSSPLADSDQRAPSPRSDEPPAHRGLSRSQGSPRDSPNSKAARAPLKQVYVGIQGATSAEMLQDVRLAEFVKFTFVNCIDYHKIQSYTASFELVGNVSPTLPGPVSVQGSAGRQRAKGKPKYTMTVWVKEARFTSEAHPKNGEVFYEIRCAGGKVSASKMVKRKDKDDGEHAKFYTRHQFPLASVGGVVKLDVFECIGSKREERELLGSSTVECDKITGKHVDKWFALTGVGGVRIGEVKMKASLAFGK